MRRRVYIETSIPSHYFSRRTDPLSVVYKQWTRDWWDNQRVEYELMTSVVTFQELRNGEYPDKAEKIGFLEGVEILPESPEIGEIVKTYIENKLMPQDVTGDAAHLAFASFFGADYLLTWNCKHIANRNKERHVRIINGRLGLSIPALVTPHDMLSLEDSL